MTQREVKPTIAPAMDIQISSNFERYLHHLCDEDAVRVAQLMEDTRRLGDMGVDKALHDRARGDFASFAASEDTVCHCTFARIRVIARRCRRRAAFQSVIDYWRDQEVPLGA